MIYTVTFKDPDGVTESVGDDLRDQLKEKYPDLDEDEFQILYESRYEKAHVFLSRWIEYGEYLTVEFDTEKGTATVVPRK